MGVKAVDMIVEPNFDSTQAYMIGIQGTALVEVNLDACLAKVILFYILIIIFNLKYSYL